MNTHNNNENSDDEFFNLENVPSVISSKRGYNPSNRDIKDLIDIVGSKRAKEVVRDSHFQSPAAFTAWQNDKKHPERQNYGARKIDVDNDNKPEFIVYDNRGDEPVAIAVNGYKLKHSKFPMRYYYSEEYPTRDQRKGHNYKDWMEEELGVKVGNKSLKRTIDEKKANKSEFYKYLMKHPEYSNISNRFSEKIPPYRHFVSVIMPVIFNQVKAKIAENINVSPEIMKLLKAKNAKLSDVITIGKAETLSKISAHLWNRYFIEPIMNQESVKALIQQYIQKLSVDKQMTQKEIKEVAINKVKSRKWIKDNLARIYTNWLNDSDKLNDFSNDMASRVYEQLKDSNIELSYSKINKLQEKLQPMKMPKNLDLYNFDTSAILEDDDESLNTEAILEDDESEIIKPTNKKK